MAVQTARFGVRKGFGSAVTDSSGAATIMFTNAQGGLTWRLLRMTIGAPSSVAIGSCAVYIGTSIPAQPKDLDSNSVDARGDTWSPGGGSDFVLSGEVLTFSFQNLDPDTSVFAKVIYETQREAIVPGSRGADPTIMEWGH